MMLILRRSIVALTLWFLTMVVCAGDETWGPIKANTTLYQIARAMKTHYNDASLSQIALAIYQYNPEAFEEGNINRLVKDATLNYPPQDWVISVPTVSADQQIRVLAHQQKPAVPDTDVSTTSSSDDQEVSPVTDHASESIDEVVDEIDVTEASALTDQAPMGDDPQKETVMAADHERATVRDVHQEFPSRWVIKEEEEASANGVAADTDTDESVDLAVMSVDSLNAEALQPMVDEGALESQAETLAAMATQLQALNEQVTNLTQALAEVAMDQAPVDAVDAGMELSHYQGEQGNFISAIARLWQEAPAHMALSGLLLVFLLLLLVVLALYAYRSSGRTDHHGMSTSTTPDIHESNDDGDDDQDYDLFASPEGVPAKLDLARAYIRMSDYPAACHLLHEVMATGSDQERAEAETVLAEIPSENRR